MPASKIPLAAAFVLAVAVCASLAVRFVHVALNTSTSMPLGLYRTWSIDRAPVRGDIVTACAPAAAARVGVLRGYLPHGSCGADAAPLIKYVAAVGGDTVAVTKGGVSIDGKPLRDSRALRSDDLRRPLLAYAAPSTRLRAGQIWLYAPQSRSYDSRYFGPVSSTLLRAFAAPLFPLSQAATREYRF